MSVDPPNSQEVMEHLRSTSGLAFLQSIAEGQRSQPPIAQLMDFRLVEVTAGRVVFSGTPQLQHYNPIGSVHGGYACTLLDSCMACSVQSMLQAGQGYTTLELKVNLVRPITDATGPVQAIGEVIHVGRRTGTAEGKLVDASGKLLAHGTTTCLIMSLS